MAVITGGPGPDTLNDTPDDDTISGLGGDDTIIVSQGGDDTADGGADNDTLQINWSTSFTGVGNTAGPIDDGFGGYSGGFTNGFDRSVDYTGIERFVITTGSGDDLIITGDGDDVIQLSNGDDIASGRGGRDNIRGGDGNDLLDGGTGADTLRGGGGNDTYVVDAGGDRVEETANNGIDEVRSSVSYTLGAHLENLTLTGAAAINGTGNALDNVVTGNDSDNILDGAAGADTLRGEDGNDTYIVDASDTVIETAGEGTDTVRAGFSYTLGANLERLVLTGSAAINGTGNALDNVITGNDAANILDGGLGADTLRGNGGNDTYIVDNAGDVIDENPGGGTDLVRSSVSFTLGAEVEKLTLTGGAAIDGTGNGLDNVITGNNANNVLRGLGGNDRLEGRDGDDQLFGGLGNDLLYGQNGADEFRFDTALDATTNVDTLADFEAGIDSIFLKNSIFTAAGPNGTLDAEAYHEGTAAAEADDRIIYDPASGFIYYDADGAGGADQILFARVEPGTDLNNTDFIIYG